VRPPAARRHPSDSTRRRNPGSESRHNFSKSGFVGQCLSQHGYTQWTNYQPAGRFWAFQWTEGGWLLALSALLIAATVWLVHRRAA
jgi:hypothetical protein